MSRKLAPFNKHIGICTLLAPYFVQQMRAILLLLLCTCWVASVKARAQEYEDNDFAEFEVFEEEDELIEDEEDQSSENGGMRGGADAGAGGGGGGGGGGAGRAEGGGGGAGMGMEVDEDEVIVEVLKFPVVL